MSYLFLAEVVPILLLLCILRGQLSKKRLALVEANSVDSFSQIGEDEMPIELLKLKSESSQID